MRLRRRIAGYANEGAAPQLEIYRDAIAKVLQRA
jgi:hypothetical protein